ncbi:MAG: type II secretion system protein GspG [Nitrospinota bacterium]
MKNKESILNTMKSTAAKMIVALGIGLLLLASAPATALSTVEAKEQRLVVIIVDWARVRRELRAEPVSGPDRKAMQERSRLLSMSAQRLVKELRPEFMSDPPAPTREVFRYVLSLARKYRPEEEASLQSEFDHFLVEETKTLLNTLRAGLENYLADRAEYPKPENLPLSKAISSTYVRLPETLFDQAGRIIDYWGRPIVYRSMGPHEYVLYSIGPNGKDEGGQGDDVKPSG